jgi:hypothetical protein
LGKRRMGYCSGFSALRGGRHIARDGAVFRKRGEFKENRTALPAHRKKMTFDVRISWLVDAWARCMRQIVPGTGEKKL